MRYRGPFGGRHRVWGNAWGNTKGEWVVGDLSRLEAD